MMNADTYPVITPDQFNTFMDQFWNDPSTAQIPWQDSPKQTQTAYPVYLAYQHYSVVRTDLLVFGIVMLLIAAAYYIRARSRRSH